MPIIGSLLNNDFYNFTMGQYIAEFHPFASRVRYAFINRNGGFRIADLVDKAELQSEIDALLNTTLTERELSYLSTLGVFSEDEIKRLRKLHLAHTVEVNVEVDKATGQFLIEGEGPWCDAVYLETPMLSIINELVSKAQAEAAGLSEQAVRQEGLQSLSYAIGGLLANPGVKFSQFGARRRYSSAWEAELTARLMDAVPDQMVGIANVELAMRHGVAPSGTMAHQLFMVTTAMRYGHEHDNPVVAATRSIMHNWQKLYGDTLGGKLMTLLPDTYGTDFTFDCIEPGDLDSWQAVRQDSGDPFEIGNKVIAAYQSEGFDPRDRMVLFSDGLNLNKMIELYNEFNSQIKVGFGWGTNLTNNVGLPTHSLVWKPTQVQTNRSWISCVKLSDNIAKATGDPAMIERVKQDIGYTSQFNELQTV